MKSSKKKSKKIIQKPEIKNSKFTIVKRIALFVFAISILSFNVFVKVNVSAENSTESITAENLLKAHNDYRKENGLPELKLNNLLNNSSRKKGDAMLASNCWSHYCPEGKSPWDFFDDSGYDYIYAGENLAEGYYTMDTLMQAWINSKTHRENIVKPEFNEVGFSILYGDYLNNSNNILVVAHFGSRSAGAVESAQNPTINLTTPANNTNTQTDQIDVSGTVDGLDKVKIFDNNSLSGEAQINEGIFTYRIQNLTKGNNSIWAEGSNSDTTINSNRINVVYDSQTSNIVPISQTDNTFSISAENKNLLNLAFIIFLALIFLADIIIVSRSEAINSQKSFSHYHLALILLVALIILIGGYAGQIHNGISV